MRKLFAAGLIVLIFCMLTACTEEQQSHARQTEPAEISAGYTPEQAVEDGCVLYKNGDISAGQEQWDTFLAKVEKGQDATVRLAFYYTLLDESHYDADYYASIKDDYPQMFVHELTYADGTYTVDWQEDGETYNSTYRYMMHYEGEAESAAATYRTYTRYVLTNDDTVTWETIWHGTASSQLGDYIPHFTAYIDLKD